MHVHAYTWCIFSCARHVHGVPAQELKELGELYREIKDDYDAMEQRCRGADTELASQRQGSEELLRRLLAEQVRPPPRDLPRSPAFSDRL